MHAWPLQELSPRAVMQVGGGVAAPGAPMAWIAPGAALEVRAFAPRAEGPGVEIDSAGAALAPLHAHEPDEAAVLDALCVEVGRACAVDVLSAGGLVRLHRAICALRGLHPRHLGPYDVLAYAQCGSSAECARAVAMFCGLLGDFAGGVALHLGAGGGIHLGGEIVPMLGTAFVRSAFRRRFEGHGRARERLRAMPTFVMLAGEAVRPAATMGVDRRRADRSFGVRPPA